jgi:transposase
VSIKDLDRSVVTPLGEYPDAEVFTSLPRSDQINAAQMLAEWGDCRQAYPQADSLAMLGGLCPVTHASGRHRDVSFPWACNKRLRQAMTTFPTTPDAPRPGLPRPTAKPSPAAATTRIAVRILARA